MITFAGFTQWLKGVPSWAWWALLVCLGIFIARQDAKADTKNKIEVKAQKTARKVIAKQKEEAHERIKEIEQVREIARREVPVESGGRASDSVPDEYADILFND